MTITAKNIGRINVWPTYDTAREADTEESKFVGQLTVWRTNEEARANISHEEEGGGGGAPAWVPANAVIHIDLVGGDPQGRAWVAGTGEVAVDTLLGSDSNTEIFWDYTEYDPANLIAQGYNLLHQPIAFIGAIRSRILSGGTLTIKLVQVVAVPNFIFNVAAGSASGDYVIQADSRSDELGLSIYSYNGSPSQMASVANWSNVVGGSMNVIAMTLVMDRADLASNGSGAVSVTLGEGDRNSGDPLVSAAFKSQTDGQALQSITLYDPLPSTAGLSELSEV